MNIIKKKLILFICCLAVMPVGMLLLKSDGAVYIKWCVAALLLGLGAYPFTSKIFEGFDDAGWLFSKVIGIAVPGFLTYVLVASGMAKFTTALALIITLGFIATGLIYALRKQKNPFSLNKGSAADINLILFEELLFLSVFLMWTYFAGFYPAAYGTEKFMDYGFMAAMMRDESLPAVDMWYSGSGINYYYGGQYFAVFLTKITGSSISVTYNLMRSFVAGFAFVLPFSLVYRLLKKRATFRSKIFAAAGGMLSGAAVSLAGNMHYVLYGLFGGVFKLSGYEDYWFPSSTRYIGYNPVNDDGCIHEFPSYSFILGDLHAHVVNIMFVLCFAGIVSAWFLKKEDIYNKNKHESIKNIVLDPHLLILGAFAGLFQFTNYWDFVIYLTVGIIATVLLALRHKTLNRVRDCILRIAVMVITSLICAVPFNLTFDSMAQGIAAAKNHSALYQLAVLWGLPVCAVLLLFIFTVKKSLKAKPVKGKSGFVAYLDVSDMTALLLGICAIGLVIIPELIYVRDIYESGYARCNTMFKLTYQAFIMFGMAMPYAILRLLRDAKQRIAKISALFLLILLILTLGYFPYAVKCWFGDVTDTSSYQGLDATAFLETSFEDDAQAIRWLNENIEGNPVVLEAPGNSYSDSERVSAMTGLPTVAGWYVHEWLWRNDTDELNLRIADVQTIYTSSDYDEIMSLAEKYDIEYIFVGSCERETYENLNEEMLKSLGEIVFKGSGSEQSAYIIKIDR